MTVPRILVTDHDSDLRIEIVESLNNDHQYYARSTGSIREMKHAFDDSVWHILLLGTNMPDGEGIHITRALRQTYGLKLGIILIGATENIEGKIAGIHSGADAYLVKPVNLQELRATIDHLYLRLSGSNTVDFTETEWKLNTQSLELISPNIHKVDLTMTESLLLGMLLEHPGKPISRDKLCSCLPPSNLRHDTRRLDTILSRLRSKVKQKTGLHLPIHTLRNKGYTFATQPAKPQVARNA